MYAPQSLHAHQSSLTTDLYKKSICSKLKRPSNDDEQIVKSEFLANTKRRPGAPLKMQQQTTDDSGIGIPSRLCSVCGDISTGIHFGGNSCESCKAFFRRSVQCHRYQNYKCSNEERCPVNIVTRKVCQYCRYMKCTTIGMKPKWVLSDQEREEKYGSRRKRFRENRTTEEDPEIFRHLTKEEKLLIEDIAHALYQSRATYPLQFPSQLNQSLRSLPSDAPPPSATTEKPPSPSANFLIVPIQRLVLFARMLKDFNLFSEDDKVSLLKGSAIEVIVCSSNTLFNPRTHTFTNYLSRDQRTAMDDQVIPLDPLLTKLWGEELFNRTKSFLISMCNLHIDEVTSTLLVPVILFSPDRSNINEFNLVKSLQIKYVTLLRKYMNWRYGIEQTEIIYPKLLLQIVNIRTLSLAHAEIIQKVMATSSVNPLVQEVTVKPEVLIRTPTDKMDSLSLASTPNDSDRLDYDKNSSIDAESNIGSDDDDPVRKKPRSSIDDDEDSSETNLRNIWRKRQKLSSNNQTEITNIEQNNSPKPLQNPYRQIKQEFMRSNSSDYEKHSNPSYLPKRPHDHQVPNFGATYHDDLIRANRASPLRHLPPKKQSLFQGTYSSSTSDLSAYDHHLRSNQIANSTTSLTSKQFYPDNNTYENYRQQYARISSSNFQQQQNEQHLLLLSLANTQSQTPPTQSPSTHSGAPLDADEQQLLNAIHAHPNKRDLVLNLLRQMNESSMDYQTQQQRRPESSNNYDPYLQHPHMDHKNDSF